MRPSTARRSIRSGAVNIRMVVFLAVVTCPLLWFCYVYVSQTLNGGIEHYADYTKVDLKALGNFGFDGVAGTDADIPAIYRALDGKRVLLEGFMNPLHGAGGNVSDFELVYNVQICCFNGPPLVQERVIVHLPNNRSVPDFSGTFLQMTGILHEHVVREAGKVQAVYTLDLEQIRPV